MVSSRFAESRFAESRFAESRFVESRFTESRFAESRFAESRFTESHFAESRFAESRFAESRFAESRFAKYRFQYRVIINLNTTETIMSCTIRYILGERKETFLSPKMGVQGIFTEKIFEFCIAVRKRVLMHFGRTKTNFPLP